MMITVDALRALDFGSSAALAFRRAFPSGLDTTTVTPDTAAGAGVDIVTMAQIAEDAGWLAWLASASNTDVRELVAMSAFVDAPTLAVLAASAGEPVVVDGVTVDQHASVREAALRNARIERSTLLSLAPSASASEALAIRGNPIADAEIIAILPS